MTIKVNYVEDINVPISSVEISNPKGFKDLELSVDTRRGTRNASEAVRRIKISNGDKAVFIAVDSLNDLVDGLERLVDYGIDGAAA